MTMSINDIQNDYYDRGWMAAWDAAEDRIDELEAENERLKEELKRLTKNNQRLKELLQDATDSVEEYSQYAGEYLYKKHGVAEEIARYRAALQEGE
jgi:predicted nuclease with TOPRIM domain